jgi:hypothetical protein
MAVRAAWRSAFYDLLAVPADDVKLARGAGEAQLLR